MKHSYRKRSAQKIARYLAFTLLINNFLTIPLQAAYAPARARSHETGSLCLSQEDMHTLMYDAGDYIFIGSQASKLLETLTMVARLCDEHDKAPALRSIVTTPQHGSVLALKETVLTALDHEVWSILNRHHAKINSDADVQKLAHDLHALRTSVADDMFTVTWSEPTRQQSWDGAHAVELDIHALRNTPHTLIMLPDYSDVEMPTTTRASGSAIQLDSSGNIFIGEDPVATTSVFNVKGTNTGPAINVDAGTGQEGISITGAGATAQTITAGTNQVGFTVTGNGTAVAASFTSGSGSGGGISVTAAAGTGNAATFTGNTTGTTVTITPGTNTTALSLATSGTQPGLVLNGGTPALNIVAGGANVVGSVLLKNQSQLRLQNPAGTFYAALQAPVLLANYTLTLPLDTGTNTQVLTTDGTGVLSWTTVASAANTYTNGGNAFGGNATLGTTDNFSQTFITNNIARMSIANSGAVTINTPTSGVGLTISGGGLTSTGTTTLTSLSTAGVVQTNGSGVLSSSNGTNGQVLIGGGSAPTWANLTAGTGISITNGANSITVATSGTTAISFPTDSGTATPSSGALTIAGGSNITTSGSGSTVTVDLDSTVSVSGSITAGTGLIATTGGVTATAGGVTATAGNITATAGNIVATAGSITATNNDIFIGSTAANATANDLAFQKSRSGGVITTGDALGNILFQGHDGSGYVTGSQIISTSSGTIATNRVASNLEFYTHPDSTTASTQRMTINSAGNVTINTPDSGTALTVSGGGASVTGTTNINTTGSAVTTIGTGGTGAVNIGNTTGNTAVTGSLTASTGLTATTGNVTATAGNVVASSGSAAAPSFTFLGDTNTGFSAATADTLIVSTDGTTRMTFGSTGSVTVPGIIYADGGIDTTSASGTLDIATTNADVVNIGTASTTQTINVGTGAGVTAINIGGAGDTITISGTLTTVNTTNLDVADKLITVNDGGAASSGFDSGIQIEEGGSATGYAKTNGTAASWLLKAPATAGIVTITPGASGFTIDQGSHNPVTIGTANGLSINGSQVLSLQLATGAQNGALSSTDWTTFNNKVGTLAGDSGTATGSTVTIAGGSNITTSATGSTVTVDLDSTISVAGSVTAGTGLVATTGGLTVSAGGASITGTTNINTSGSAVTTIGTGGTGAVNIGNTTGNTAVTGSLTASTGLTATAGGVTATAGNITATAGNIVATAGSITATNNDIFIGSTAANATSNELNFQKSRSGGVITTGDVLGTITFQGHDGTTYEVGSQILSTSSGTIATGRVASNLEFYTHPDSTTDSTQRMTINSAGNVTINAPDSGTALTVSAGGASITGTTTINTTGSAVTTIGTGGTGAVNIGNTTGNTAVTGSLTASTGLTATTGGVTATAGNVTVSSGNLALTNSTSSSTGNITKAGTRFLTNYGTGNTFVGESSGNFTLTTGSALYNTGIGASSLNALTTGTENTAVGFEALLNNVSGNNNTALGYSTGNTLTTGSYNILIGYDADVDNATRSNCINITAGGASAALTGDNQISIGFGNSASTATFIDGIDTTNIGVNVNIVGIAASGQLGTTATTFTLSGAETITTGNLTLSNGNIVLTESTSASTGNIIKDNTRFLHAYGSSNDNNTFLGASSGNFTLTTGTAISNTGIGASSLSALTTGSANTAVGFDALANNTTGNTNTAVGSSALNINVSGSNNTALGRSAGDSITTGSNNILIGYNADVDAAARTNCIVIGTGVTTSAADNQIRIGFGGTASTSCFIQGIESATVGASSTVLINSSGQLGTIVSSRRYKDNIENLGNITPAFMQLQPVTFNYKADTTHAPQYGLIAEDVEPLFPDLVVYNNEGEVQTVQYHLLHALYIKMLQDHQRMFDAYEQTITDLKNRVQALEQK